MKAYQRREVGSEAYFKLAVYDPRSMTFRDGKVAYATEAEARAAANQPGRYRISRVDGRDRTDHIPFDR